MFACAALAATPVFAQEAGSSRRPLADVADLEPAVDVGRSETTAPPRVSAPAAEAPAAAAPAVVAQASNRGTDSLDLGTTSITGNQELPKVLYIVPWKRSDLGDHVGRPVNTLLDEVLEPIDPEVFERHLDYYETLHGVSREE
jgi:hypothetical protein